MTPATSIRRPRRAVYLDYNATAPVRPEAFKAMRPFLLGEFGNPSSVHILGQRARRAVEEARARVAELLGASAGEIVFTSSGSEADAMAVRGAALRAFEASGGKKRAVVSSPIEHEAVLGALEKLERRGFEVKFLPVGADGTVAAQALPGLLDDSTALVTVMHANNETGAVQPVRELAGICRERGVIFHTDAVQSAGKIPVDAREIGADLLSISGHKLGAPKGVGALYIRRGVSLVPLISGAQEKNRRGGTENVPGIVGLGEACRLSRTEALDASRYAALRSRMLQKALKIPGSRLTAGPEGTLPHMAHFCFEGISGPELVAALDLEGIAVSSGPACSSGSPEPSHVLLAMGIPPEIARGALRVSMGFGTKTSDVERFLKILSGAVEALRRVPAESRP